MGDVRMNSVGPRMQHDEHEAKGETMVSPFVTCQLIQECYRTEVVHSFRNVTGIMPPPFY